MLRRSLVDCFAHERDDRLGVESVLDFAHHAGPQRLCPQRDPEITGWKNPHPSVDDACNNTEDDGYSRSLPAADLDVAYDRGATADGGGKWTRLGPGDVERPA
jgi:hypothetical protein